VASMRIPRRGHYTRVWAEGGRVFSQGTVFTITLFLLMVLGKFALGTAAYLAGVSDDGGFGNILLMIALMIAFQAQIIWRRAAPLGARRQGTDLIGTSVDSASTAAGSSR